MRCLLPLAFALILPAAADAQNPREKKVRDDKVKVEADGYWIYNNLPKAFEEAKTTGKPMLVILRCIPCEECVKLDDELVDKNPLIRPLLDKYVRVRVVSTNGLDLSLFQYDYDQSFACFLLNADGTIYGRFGTRSHRTNWVGDVSIDGLAKALQGGLDLHARFDTVKKSLTAKRGPAPLFPVPEKFPLLGKYTSKLNYEGNVVQSCIHCHQVGDAIKDYHRNKKEPTPENVLFPYPHPKSLGLILDPKEMATVKAVDKTKPAGRAGFEPGDKIVKMDGQPILSIADVQWVMHGLPADEPATVEAEVIRGGKTVELDLKLAKGWRQADDISWRSSSWGLRRMGTAGMKLDSLEERPAGVPAKGTALRVAHVGMYGGPHGAAKAAGIQVGDTLIAFDGRTDLLRETDVFAYAMRSKKAGDAVAVKVVRGGKTLEMNIPMQE